MEKRKTENGKQKTENEKQKTENGKRRVENWGFPLRVLGKALVLFIFLNLLFALLSPMEALGGASLYNWLLPGRERLPYGENSALSYNLSLFNVPAMMASHELQRAKAEDEFRVLLIGDSASWGWFLANEDTLSGQLNALDLRREDGRRVVVYNLAYPVMSLTKDLMFLDAARGYDADLILWPVTLESFPREKQLFAPVVQQNPDRVRPLIESYELQLDTADPRFADPTFLQQTAAGQRRNLADLIRLQAYGFSWAATGIDQYIPPEITPRRSDFEPDYSWQSFTEPVVFSADDLAWEALDAGRAMAGEAPVLLVNEPMFISDGVNSDIRYNSFYPRWAYDQYRQLLAEKAQSEGWFYLDLWDKIAPQEFTDTPVHLTPQGSRQMAELIAPHLQSMQ
jgi:lysophospholipase L1-like esterase